VTSPASRRDHRGPMSLTRETRYMYRGLQGQGFQGTVKRHGFGRGPVSHGSHNIRQPGSVGASADPARIFPGQKMPGQMGNKGVTVKNLAGRRSRRREQRALGARRCAGRQGLGR
jgi:hypothetical protein